MGAQRVFRFSLKALTVRILAVLPMLPLVLLAAMPARAVTGSNLGPVTLHTIGQCTASDVTWFNVGVVATLTDHDDGIGRDQFAMYLLDSGGTVLSWVHCFILLGMF